MADNFLMRDFFSEEIVRKIARDISSVYPAFKEKLFLKSILPELPRLGYGERKTIITAGLIEHLPKEFDKSVEILLRILPPPYKEGISSDEEDRFYVGAYTAYIAKMGLEHFETSINALKDITKTSTSEWAVRPFILKYPKQTLKLLRKWSQDKNMHVRRWISEGSRPNLPWGSQLKFIDENPENTTLPILEKLQDDPSEYVRRSVANHLNDLAKNNPDLIVETLSKWQKTNLTKDKERMINHAIRTLIKQGHKGALKLIGYDSDFKVNVDLHSITQNVNWNGKFEFAFSIQNPESDSQKLLIDFVIGFQKKDGSISDKVFKLKKIDLEAGQEIEINKGHSFKPITTRVYYPGKHTLKIQINGEVVAESAFELLKP